MAARKRKVRSTKASRSAIQLLMGAKPLHDEMLAVDNSLNDRFAFNELQRNYLLLEKQYAELRDKLVSLLLPEQIEAAKTCGVTPEFYALEWIQIHYRDALTKQSTLYRIAPSYAAHVSSLRGL